ncbi:MAG: flagellar hook-associated protein FlgK, partial [Janthinobacterium lividum]
MSDLFSIGASGVAAYQAALDVVGDNVANADTPGYVRRSVTLKIAAAGGSGSPTDRDISAGSGVRTGDILRSSDAIKTAAVRDADSDLSRITTRSEWLTRLQSVLGSGDASLTKQLAGFFDAAQDLSVTPQSTAARTIFLDRADQIASQFRTTAQGLDDLGSDLAAATTDATAQVNRLTTTLAQINLAVIRTHGTGEAGNALLDQRDVTLADLAKLVRITTTETGDGAVEVRLGDSGTAPLLVSAGTATAIAVRDGPGGAELVLHPTHDPVVVRLPASGTLAGLIETSRRVTETAATIDDLADRFALATNTQHEAGVDASGADGKPLFATRTVSVVPGKANGGTAAVDVVISDTATIDAAGYRLSFDGSAWSLAQANGTDAVAGTGALSIDGLTVTPSSTAKAGDTFVLAARAGAAGISLRTLDPSQVAAASRWLTDAGGANTGSGTIAVTIDAAAAALPVLPAYRVVVTSTGSADIVNDADGSVIGTAAITGSSIAGAGFTFSIGGAPAIGDSFRITRNDTGVGDNGNVRALVALRAESGGGGTIEANL